MRIHYVLLTSGRHADCTMGLHLRPVREITASASRTLYAIWPPAKQGDRLTPSAQLIAPIQRTFAEFPFTRSWQEIAIHAQRLEGATHVGLFGQRTETWLRFIYEGEDFCIQDGNSRLTIAVEDASCPEHLLHEVQRHFVALFSPELSD